MNEALTRLLERAGRDPELKRRLYESKNAENPLSAFCALSRSEGILIYPDELAFGGENFCAEMLRSVNGGGVDAPSDWDDMYELFFAALDMLGKSNEENDVENNDEDALSDNGDDETDGA